MLLPTKLETILQDWRERLWGWAADGSLASAARHALELGTDDPPLLSELVNQWTDGDFSGLPPIVLLPASSMPGAAGAYAISTGAIYLNVDLLETAGNERLIAVLTEELGHHLDALLNPADTPGDEGELFSRHLLRTDLIADHDQAIRHEQEQNQILVNGEWIAAETSGSPTPTTPDLTPASDTGSSDTDDLTSDTTPNFTGTAEAGSTVELFAGATSLGSTTADGSGNWSFTVPDASELADGSYDITATASTGSSGSTATLQSTPIPVASPGRTTQEWRNNYAFAAIKDDGSVITWGNPVNGGDSRIIADQLSNGVVEVYSSKYAFAALKDDGSVIAWGNSADGGDSRAVATEISSGVSRVFSARSAFAALKNDGSVVTWGDPKNGGDSSSVSNDLRSGVVKIFSTASSFAALNIDGSVISWGDSDWGGDSSLIAKKLQENVVDIVSTTTAFAAIKDDGSVVGWGQYGVPSEKVVGQISSGVVRIYSNKTSFAALKEDGSVIAWGGSGYGDDSSSVSNQLNSDVFEIFSNDRAFAALKSNGSVVTWGGTGSGGDNSNLIPELSSGVSQIFSTVSAFAALKEDGSVVAWGDAYRGGDTSYVSNQLSTGVSRIVSNDYAFAALKEDGSVVTWGASDKGGDNGAVSEKLNSGVLQIISTEAAFAALKDDGSVVTWGLSSFGGDSSSVSAQLQSGVISFADPFHDDRLVAGSPMTSDASPALTLTVDTTAPSFTSAGTAAAIDENSGAGQLIYTATATDDSFVSYSLKAGNKGDAAAFAIDEITGEVTLTANPDYETQSSYAFTVVATDAAGNSSEQRVMLAINDVKGESIRSLVTRRLRGNEQNLTLIGNKAINGTGNNLNNRLTGNAANNVLNGRGGRDVMAGRKGNDTYIVNHVKDVVSEGKNAGTDTVKASVSHTLNANVERLVLTGRKAINGTGNNLNNRLTGNAANNVLNGLGGRDRIIGRSGDDSLIGGTGKDTMSGGLGADVFIYRSIRDSGIGGAKRDLITDFRGSIGDRIDLSAIDTSKALSGDQEFTYIGSDPFSGIQAEVRFESGILQANTGSGKSADMEIFLKGVASFDASHLFL